MRLVLDSVENATKLSLLCRVCLKLAGCHTGESRNYPTQKAFVRTAMLQVFRCRKLSDASGEALQHDNEAVLDRTKSTNRVAAECLATA